MSFLDGDVKRRVTFAALLLIDVAVEVIAVAGAPFLIPSVRLLISDSHFAVRRVDIFICSFPLRFFEIMEKMLHVTTSCDIEKAW